MGTLIHTLRRLATRAALTTFRLTRRATFHTLVDVLVHDHSDRLFHRYTARGLAYGDANDLVLEVLETFLVREALRPHRAPTFGETWVELVRLADLRWGADRLALATCCGRGTGC